MTREGAEWALGVGVGGSLLAGGDVGRVVQEVFELDEVAGSQRRVLHTPPGTPPSGYTSPYKIPGCHVDVRFGGSAPGSGRS